MSRGVNGYGSSFNGECPPPPPAPPMQIHCTSLKLTPTRDGQWKKGPVTYNGVTRSFDETDSGPTISDLSGAQNEPSTLVASIKGESVGAGNCRLYASLPRKTSAGSKVTGDPQVNKLVYNMYRELLNTKHQRASNIVNSAPQEKVATDEGVSDRVISMMRQQTEPKRSKMETAPGPPPPPPPPPFQAAVDSAARPPPPAVESTPVVAMRALHKGPPAALAGAMMKDKKPFTYTPGGIDLSEINAQPPPKQNGGTAYTIPSQMAANYTNPPVTADGHPMQSRSFKVIQNAYDSQDPTNTSEAQPEPIRTYTGSNIPSRSFKILQAMTDNENESCPVGSSRNEQHNKEEVTEHPQTSNTPSHSTRVSPIRSYTCSPTIHYIGNRSSYDSDADASQSHSYISPSYTTTRDSPVYRHVSPTLNSRDTKSADRVVSKGLQGGQRISSPQWSTSYHGAPGSSSPTSSMTRASSVGVDSNRSVDSGPESKLLYGGDKIPSRIFRHIQQEFSNSPTGVHSTNNSTSGSPSIDQNLNEETLPRMINRIYITNGNDNSLDNDVQQSIDDISKTKASVLKELTSQFDPKTHFKKPKAAPGKVFKYLQETYDASSENSSNGMSSSVDSSSGKSSTSMSISSVEDGHYDVEPKPYSGCRIPGRTFRMLQDNIGTHPSVFQARK